MLKNRKIKTIILIYNKYIDKIAKKFNLISLAQFLSTPLLIEELIKNNREAIK